MARPTLMLRPLLLGLALIAGGAASCERPEVGELETERYAACEEGYECASGKCEFPHPEFEALGCFAEQCSEMMLGNVCLSPDLTYPNCEDESNTAAAYCGVEPCKEACVAECDANDNMQTDEDEQECYDTCESDPDTGCFARRLACVQGYNAWKEERDVLRGPFFTCLEECEGDTTSVQCDEFQEDDTENNGFANNCDELIEARHEGVKRAGDCSADESQCDLVCSDIYDAG